jgi:hypothetical protein
MITLSLLRLRRRLLPSIPQFRARDFGLPPPSPSTQARRIEIEQLTVGHKHNNLPRDPPASKYASQKS